MIYFDSDNIMSKSSNMVKKKSMRATFPLLVSGVKRGRGVLEVNLGIVLVVPLGGLGVGTWGKIGYSTA